MKAFLFVVGVWLSVKFVGEFVDKLIPLDPYLFDHKQYTVFITCALLTIGFFAYANFENNHSADKTIKKYGALIKNVLITAGCETGWCQCLPINIPIIFSSSRVLTVLGHFEGPKNPYAAFVLEIQHNKIKRFQLLDGKDFDEEIFTHVANVDKSAKISGQPFFDEMVKYVYNSSKKHRINNRLHEPFFDLLMEETYETLKNKIINIEFNRYK